MSQENNPFSKEDYLANDGMLTTVWGPSLWHFLHCMSFNYPVSPTPSQQREYMSFIKNLIHVLPCRSCRENLTKNFRKLPLKQEHMKNRESFSRYVYDLHEVVNTMLHKTSGLSFHQVRERYEHFRARCTKEHSKAALHSLATQSRRKGKGKGKRKEKGCTEPLYGSKAKCILRIVPQKSQTRTFDMHKSCLKKKLKGGSFDKRGAFHLHTKRRKII